MFIIIFFIFNLGFIHLQKWLTQNSNQNVRLRTLPKKNNQQNDFVLYQRVFLCTSSYDRQDSKINISSANPLAHLVESTDKSAAGPDSTVETLTPSPEEGEVLTANIPDKSFIQDVLFSQYCKFS